MANELQPAGRHRLCRLCLTDKDDLYPIFGGAIPDLAEKIYDCTVVEINRIERIPALICQLCRSKIVVCHQFVESCQRADRKYHRLYGSQFRQHKQFKQDLVPAQNESTKHVAVRRLMDDDKLRRHSIEDGRKVETKPVIVRPRLSDESKPVDTSIERIAAEIEQSLKHEDNRNGESVKRKCPKCCHLFINLEKHMLVHSNRSKHVCKICNMTFERKCNMTYHTNLHTGEKPYKCKHCEARFSCPSRLWTHKQTHQELVDYRLSEDRRFHCNVCKSVFKHRKLIDQHMRTEHLERKHACEICGKAYFTRKTLNAHMKLVHKQTNPN